MKKNKQYFFKQDSLSQGLTIIELLVAMVILSVAILPLIASMTNMSKYARQQEQKNYAISQAVHQLEEIKKNYLAAFPQTTYPLPASGSFALPPDESGVNYTCEWVYSPLERDSTYYENHSFLVTVAVTWPGTSQPRKVEFTTAISSR